MTQIIATLENGADPKLIRQIFDNVKGVIATSISFNKDKTPTNYILAEDTNNIDAEKKEWLNKLNHLYNNIDRDAIDLTDERTRYILSK